MNLYRDRFDYPRHALGIVAPTKVVEIEVSRGVRPLSELEGYRSVLALVRLGSAPVGYLVLPVENGGCSARLIAETLIEKLREPLLETFMEARLRTGLPDGGIGPSELLRGGLPEAGALRNIPLVTVCITTRDRTHELRGCLETLRKLDYPRLEFVVVDNAPSDDGTRRLVEDHFKEMRYVAEERPGQSWARNRGFVESSGDIIAFTDDDVRPDREWVSAIVRRFEEDPEASVVTGLIVPFELETEAQVAIESYAGMGRGFRRIYNRVYPVGPHRDDYHIEAFAFGAGANMAFRRDTLERFGGFDPVLGPGSAVGAGEDPEMFFRVLEGGALLVYEPTAIVRHRHRREMREAEAQIMGWASGFSAYLVRNCALHPRLAPRILGYMTAWWYRVVRSDLMAAIRPMSEGTRLHRATRRGAVRGLLRLPRAIREARRSESGVPPDMLPKRRKGGPSYPWPRRRPVADLPTAIRAIDVTRPISALQDLHGFYDTLLLVTSGERMLGRVVIRNLGEPISAACVRDEVSRALGPKLMRLRSSLQELAEVEVLNALNGLLRPDADRPGVEPVTPSVTVVIPTRDRPDHLRRCLSSVVGQDMPTPFEIIVVDNNPASGKTPGVVRDFPGVRLIDEPISGTSAARNAGFAAARSEVVAMIDDDAAASASWLRQLVMPFARADVAVVCGNTLPIRLEQRAEKRFERFGGLGRGFTRFEMGSGAFYGSARRAVPVWDIGATANCAVRREVLADPGVGLMDEQLGPGTPTSASEDLYTYYRILKRGHTMVYEPSAYVFHSHRTEMPALRGQIYAWAKGQYAYQLNTLFRDRDYRAVVQMFFALPKLFVARAIGLRSHPRSLILPEIIGSLVGPFGYALARLKGRPREPLDLCGPESSEPDVAEKDPGTGRERRGGA